MISPVLPRRAHSSRYSASSSAFGCAGKKGRPKRAAGTRERDLVLVEGIGQDRKAAILRQRFAVPPGEFRAILIGKDGGDKLTSREPIGADRLFAEIDAMPMRRNEVQRRQP